MKWFRIKSTDLITQLYDFRGAPLVALSVLSLFFLERRYPLRERKMPALPRLLTNIKLVPLATLSLRLALVPAVVWAAKFSQQRNAGLLRWLPFPSWLANMAGSMLLDYGNYGWHRLNHRSRWLWRFHQVHHADLDMDVSTGLRFHVVEMLISVFYRAGWVALAGVGPRTTLWYEIAFEIANNFITATPAYLKSWIIGLVACWSPPGCMVFITRLSVRRLTATTALCSPVGTNYTAPSAPMCRKKPSISEYLTSEST